MPKGADVPAVRADGDAHLGKRLPETLAAHRRDKHDALASQLNVGGLPTVLLFKGGKEVRRVEGALMKDQLVSFATSDVPENSAESACRPP